VRAAGCTSTFDDPVAARVTDCPATAPPFTSRTVTVIVEVSTPSAATSVDGLATAVQFAALICDGSPAKVTVGCWRTTTWPGRGSRSP
jgi:hypothetical protein